MPPSSTYPSTFDESGSTSLNGNGSLRSSLPSGSATLHDEEKGTHPGAATTGKTTSTAGTRARAVLRGGMSAMGKICRYFILVVFIIVPLLAIGLALAFTAITPVVAFASLLLSLFGVTLLGLTNTVGHVIYTHLTVESLIVATAYGAAVITAAGMALALPFLAIAMCTGSQKLVIFGSVLAGCCGAVATFFAPAIGIGLANLNGRILGLRVEFTAAEAMRMNGAGLGGVLVWVLADTILYGIGYILLRFVHMVVGDE